MKTIFDKTTRGELINRIRTLDEHNKAQWGKMNVYQMLKHCTLFEEWILGMNQYNQYKYKQAFIGRVFGKMVLKGMIKDERPMKRNMPTTADLIVKEKHGDIASQKIKWIALIEEYAHYSNPAFIHDFFGKMTVEQIGYFNYKHTDHHLRQFNG